jgi:long-chain-fatty-acid--CoA ligase ACSBG
VIVLDTADQLSRFLVNLDKMPKVKAFVVWGEKSLPAECKGDRFYLWKDFLNLGKHIPDSSINERMSKQRPGECCCLVYTSGTTGNPKGCMLSHDNLTWNTVQLNYVQVKDRPNSVGPKNRIVSYLPLSHIAGFAFEFLAHLLNSCEIYYAKPDAL